MARKNEPVNEIMEQGFVMVRVFDAPRALVFKVFTEPAHLAKWWGPKGFTIHVSKLDLRPGGIFLFCMQSPEVEMWAKFVYREIVEPERLVYVLSFSDAEGNTTRQPESPTWPLEMLTTVTLSEHQGKTTLTLKVVPVNATAEEHKTFEEGFPSMQQGFTGTWDQLADHLAEIQG